jgi:hypothetical protein
MPEPFGGGELLMARNKKRNKSHQPTIGYCNICNQQAILTWDHVPPKGSIKLTPVEIRAFLDTIGESDGIPVEYYGDYSHRRQFHQRRFSQNGVKYRSICAECNNKRLGARYDPEVKRVSDEVATLVRSRIEVGLNLPKHLPSK